MWNGGEAEKAASPSPAWPCRWIPACAKAYYFIGLDHLSRGENAEAKAALQKFIDMAPDDPRGGDRWRDAGLYRVAAALRVNRAPRTLAALAGLVGRGRADVNEGGYH